eukprot:g3463.t1
MSDFYQTLGISRDADLKTIKKAFRKLAVKHHPDKGGDPEKFKQVSEAYATLSDPEKKRDYDRFGKRSGGGNAGRSAGFQQAQAEELFRQFFAGGDPFAAAFGAGGMPGGGSGGISFTTMNMGGMPVMFSTNIGGGSPFGMRGMRMRSTTNQNSRHTNEAKRRREATRRRFHHDQVQGQSPLLFLLKLLFQLLCPPSPQCTMLLFTLLFWLGIWPFNFRRTNTVSYERDEIIWE